MKTSLPTSAHIALSALPALALLAAASIIAAPAQADPEPARPAADGAPGAPYGWWLFEEGRDDASAVRHAFDPDLDGVVRSEAVARDPDAPAGGAIVFLGRGDPADGDPDPGYVVVPGFDSESFSESFTVAFWACPFAAPPPGRVAPLASWLDEDDPDAGFAVFFDDALSPCTSDGLSGPAVEAGDWHHFAVVRDGASIALYMDGGLVLEDDLPAAPEAVSPLRIGSLADEGGTAVFTGAMADLRIFAEALSDEEVALVHADGSPAADMVRDGAAIPREEDDGAVPARAGADAGAAPAGILPPSFRRGRVAATLARTAGDSDGDGMPDAWELEYGLDPLDPADAAEDPDHDGMANLREYRLGRDPRAQAITSQTPLIHLH